MPVKLVPSLTTPRDRVLSKRYARPDTNVFGDGLEERHHRDEDYDIDTYLAEINVVVDDLRSPVHLVDCAKEG